MAINTDYTVGNASQAPDARQFASGRLTMSSDALTATDHILLEVGFTPRYIRVENLTDRIAVEWFEGMADNTCLKTAAAGTKTLETSNGGVTVCDEDGNATEVGRNFKVLQNATLAVVAADAVLTWVAIA